MESLSTSPKSVSYLAYNTAYIEDTPHISSSTSIATKDDDDGPITLSEFIEALPPVLHKQKDDAQKSIRECVRQDDMRGTKEDPVNELFSRLDLSTKELRPYRLFEPNKNYTRNLIATDNETFTLLLLCWNAEKESPIHDHPCDGCWLRVCEGKIRETRYKIDKDTDKMEVTSDETYEDDHPAFIKDSMGYHKIGNTSKQPAMTLHLYCPPFNKCKIWLDPTNASKPSNAYMCNYSEFGVKHTCKMFEVVTI